MKRILIAGAAATFLGIGGPVDAADIPTKGPIAAPALFNWSGFYVGVHAGYGFGDSLIDFAAGVPPSPNRMTPNIDGWLAGGHVGFNWQINQIVLGIEASWSWADITGFQTDPLGPPPIGGRVTVRDLGLILGRLGWANNNWLLFVQGGYANSSVRSRYFDPTGTITTNAIINTTRHPGWALGFGAEVAVTPNIILGADYLYVSLNTVSHAGTNNFGAPIPPGNHFVDADFHLVRARLSYLFNWGR